MYSIGVAQTPSTIRTVEYILLLIRKLTSNSLVFKEGIDSDEAGTVETKKETPSSYKECTSITKKESMTPSTVYYLQLKQITGFACTLVNAIVSRYPSLVLLIISLHTAPEEVGWIKVSEKR